MIKSKKPHWIGFWDNEKRINRGISLHYWKCSECSSLFEHAFAFCPNCGADMQKKRTLESERNCSDCIHNTGETCDWWQCDYEQKED